MQYPSPVGGRTRGSATTASIRNFQRHRENVTQYAMGRPATSKIPATDTASFNESVIACQFKASPWRAAQNRIARATRLSQGFLYSPGTLGRLLDSAKRGLEPRLAGWACTSLLGRAHSGLFL